MLQREHVLTLRTRQLARQRLQSIAQIFVEFYALFTQVLLFCGCGGSGPWICGRLYMTSGNLRFPKSGRESGIEKGANPNYQIRPIRD